MATVVKEIMLTLDHVVGWWSTSSRQFFVGVDDVDAETDAACMTCCYREYTGTMIGPFKTTSRSFTLMTFVVIPWCPPSAAMACDVGGQVRAGRSVTSVYVDTR